MKLKIESQKKPEKKGVNFKTKYSGKVSAKECNNNTLKSLKKNGNRGVLNRHSILDQWLIKIYSKSPKNQEETEVTTKTSDKIDKRAPELIVKLERLNIQLRNGEYIVQNSKGETSLKKENISNTKLKKRYNKEARPHNKTNKCPHCSFETESLSKFYFYKHVRSHMKQETEKCPVCNKDIKWFSYKSHLKSHQRKPKVCNLNYTKLEKNKYQCVKCDYICTTSGSINTHHDAKHSDKIHKCSHCSFETKLTYYFNSHIRSHQKPQTEKCPYCKKDIKWFSYRMHLKTHERNDRTERKCDLCSYKSYNGANVKRHMLTHKHVDELEKFKCDLCDFITVFKDGLNTHKKMVHTKEGKWKKCEICDYSTRRPSHFARHRLIHSRTSVQCTECFKFYTCQTRLKLHTMKVHTDGVKRYFYCEMCPKDEQYKTTEKGNLARHMLAHKTKKELELFSCHKCPYLGKCKRALKEHFITRHVPELHEFKCGACEYTTPYRARFNMHHRRVHVKRKIRNVTQHEVKVKNIEEMVTSDDQNSYTSDEEEVDVDTDNEQVASKVKQVESKNKRSDCKNIMSYNNNENDTESNE